AAARRYTNAAAMLRLAASLAGYDERRERDIQELAEKGGRVDLVVESLGRMAGAAAAPRSEEHTSELQSLTNLVCRLLLEKNQPVTAPARVADRYATALGLGHAPSNRPRRD